MPSNGMSQFHAVAVEFPICQRAGGIKDGRGQISLGNGLEGVQDIALSLDRIRHLQLLTAEAQAVFGTARFRGGQSR